MNIASITAPARGNGDEDDSGSDLAIGVFASICRDRLGEQLLAFARAAPNVGIGVHEMSRTALLPALVAGIHVRIPPNPRTWMAEQGRP